MDKIYVHYSLWEDYLSGMWRDTYGAERQAYLKRAIRFTGNASLYGRWMMRVVRRWPYACLENLSDIGRNRQAFIGHAACCLALGCPEDITRLAWHQLTQQQQDAANAEADKAIAYWESLYRRGIKVRLRLNWG